MRATAARTRERPRYDDDGKDDAARFVYAAMDPRPRIRGLETIDLCRKWLEVETDRNEPRKKVIAAINKRIGELRADVEAGEQDGSSTGSEVTA